MMMGIEFMEDVPFRAVYIHGLVRDAEGQKMSKSKGNALDPIDLMDGIDLQSLVHKRVAAIMRPHQAKKAEDITRRQFPEGIPVYGADALRFTFAAMASGGRDIRFDLKRIEGYRNFCNKLWNAARFVIMNCEGKSADSTGSAHAVDEWILRRLDMTVARANQAIADYRFDRLANCLHEFVWHDYCDWFLEFSKAVQQNEEEKRHHAHNRHCLLSVLETALRLLHPVIPFISEEIWQKLKPLSRRREESIQQRPYPTAERDDRGSQDQDIEAAQEIIRGLRTLRSENQLPPQKELPLMLQGWDRRHQSLWRRHGHLIEKLAGVRFPAWLSGDETPPAAAIVLIGSLKMYVPLAGLIDLEAETKRLKKKIDSLEKRWKAEQKSSSNPDFIAKAPKDVIARKRQRLDEMQAQIQRLKLQYQSIAQAAL